MHFFKTFFIFAVIEGFIFFRITDYELFFMLWGFFYLAMLLFNIFDVESRGVNLGAGGNMSTQHNAASQIMLAGLLAEKMFGKDDNKTEKGGIFDASNLVFVILLIINIFGYLIVMPS